MAERYTRAVVIEDESLARDELNRGDARFYRCSSTCRFLEPVAVPVVMENIKKD